MIFITYFKKCINKKTAIQSKKRFSHYLEKIGRSETTIPSNAV